MWSSDPNQKVTAKDACQSWYKEIKDHIFGAEPRVLKSGKIICYLKCEVTNKGKGIEEITEGQERTNTRKLYRDISTGTAVFFNRKRVNVCEHTTRTASLESLRCRLCRGFTNNYSLPIEKDCCACQNISIQFPCVCVCLYFGDLFNS